MQRELIDKGNILEIMTPEEVALYLKKSLSWVYKNSEILGARKLRGSLFFPGKEILYELIFGKGERLEVRLYPKRNQTHRELVQEKNRGQTGGGQKKGGDIKPETDRGDQNRHGLLRVSQQEA